MDDDQRFETVFHAYSDDVQAYCLRRASVANAHDAAAEVFVAAWRRRAELPDGEQTLTWLYRTAFNVLRNQRRTRRRRQSLRQRLTGLAHPGTPGPEELTINLFSDREIRFALSLLPNRDREVVMLVVWEGLTRDQAAEVMGCSTEAAKKRYQRAIRKLERILTRRVTPTSRVRALIEGGD